MMELFQDEDGLPHPFPFRKKDDPRIGIEWPMRVTTTDDVTDAKTDHLMLIWVRATSVRTSTILSHG